MPLGSHLGLVWTSKTLQRSRPDGVPLEVERWSVPQIAMQAVHIGAG